jgi:hypothetical protein
VKVAVKAVDVERVFPEVVLFTHKPYVASRGMEKIWEELIRHALRKDILLGDEATQDCTAEKRFRPIKLSSLSFSGTEESVEGMRHRFPHPERRGISSAKSKLSDPVFPFLSYQATIRFADFLTSFAELPFRLNPIRIIDSELSPPPSEYSVS